MNSKLVDVETVAKGIFKSDFVSMAEACEVFDKPQEENDISKMSFSTSESSLRRAKEDGFFFFSVPRGIAVKDLISLTGIFHFNLSPREVVSFKMEILKPGFYLVKKEPRHLSSGGMLMREAGMTFEPNPRLAEILYYFTLCSLTGRKQMLIHKLCILCKEEVVRRGNRTPVCVEANDENINIDAWRSNVLMPNVMPVKKLL